MSEHNPALVIWEMMNVMSDLHKDKVDNKEPFTYLDMKKLLVATAHKITEPEFYKELYGLNKGDADTLPF